MTVKNDILKKLKSFRKKYLRWIYNIEGIMIEIENGKIISHEDYSECEFGKWIKRNSKLLYNVDIEHNILESHIKVHLKYSEILEFMVNETISDLIYHSAHSEKKRMFINAKINSLRNYSKNMIDALDNIIHKIEPLNEQAVVMLSSYSEFSYN